MGGEWEPWAENWIRWARDPADAYWDYSPGFFAGVLPPPGRRTLEVGSGEGRVARDLVAHGHNVVGTDTAVSLLRAARAEDASSVFAGAGGAALPFPDETFDTVVAYNALQVVDDMAATVSEIARVLVAGGHLCACIAHPTTDLGGRFTDAGFVVRPKYFEMERVNDTVQRGDLTMTFQGWTYNFEHYSVALERAGLRIEALREPRPSTAEHARWQNVPLFLFVRAVKG